MSVLDAVAMIDKTLSNIEDDPATMSWTPQEVRFMLGELRKSLVLEVSEP